MKYSNQCITLFIIHIWEARPAWPAMPAWPAGQIVFLKGLGRHREIRAGSAGRGPSKEKMARPAWLAYIYIYIYIYIYLYIYVYIIRCNIELPETRPG